ncbi:MAG: class I SAM-dependent methyltransferase [Candidatus Parcubacteria bacterium]|nr:class I SAM-dependent methyltransferase [Candidatus Parcubacteria bacterium]
MRIKKCRICDSSISTILSLGKFPAVNYYLTLEELSKKEKKYTLNFCICGNCGLGQLDEMVKAGKLFSTYHYISSTSLPLKKHLESLADVCIKRFNLTGDSKVLDIGCNDGTLLSYLKKLGMQTLGIDPAKNILEEAKKMGIKVLTAFFNGKMSKEVLNKEGQFDVIIATNTLAQVIDLNDFVKGIKHLLRDSGSFVVEVGYLPEMLRRKTFDSIYHEHYSYFSLMSLKFLFDKNGLEIYDAEEIGNHGGSLRVFAKHKENKKLNIVKRVQALIQKEKRLKISEKSTYQKFANSALEFKKDFRDLLFDLKNKNATIVGIGAPAKSVILLNFSGINHTVISYITDSTPYKQNRFMPGVHIPIMPESKLIEDKSIDYFVLLAWTYRDEIIKKIRSLKRPDVKIITPFPNLEIIT